MQITTAIASYGYCSRLKYYLYVPPYGKSMDIGVSWRKFPSYCCQASVCENTRVRERDARCEMRVRGMRANATFRYSSILRTIKPFNTTTRLAERARRDCCKMFLFTAPSWLGIGGRLMHLLKLYIITCGRRVYRKGLSSTPFINSQVHSGG